MKKKPLTRKRILDAAIKSADKSGIATLSMRKLAQALGVQAMSLYNHVTDKEDVLDGIVDIVVGEIGLPSINGNWQTAMRQRAVSARAVLLRHPWAAMLIMSRINIGPAMLAYVNATIGCLREAGFPYKVADHAWNAIDSHIYGFTLQELDFPLEASEYADAAKHYLSLVPMEKYPYLNAMAQQVIDGSHHGVQDFNFGLELILDGLEKLRKNE